MMGVAVDSLCQSWKASEIDCLSDFVKTLLVLSDGPAFLKWNNVQLTLNQYSFDCQSMKPIAAIRHAVVL